MKKLSYVLILIIVLTSNKIYGESLNLTSYSSILIDNSTGRVLYEKNSHVKKAMASTTKIMTALLALEYGNLEDNVKVDKESVGVEGSSIYLEENEIITLEDLLYGLMLRSGNDAADAIARHIGGNTERFVLLMNEKAKEIGALNTNFVNPHGLHDDSHYTTAYDLGLITREAFRSDKFKEIISTKSYISNREKNNYYANKNQTIWDYNGGNGVKTGYTTRSGRCLVSSATKNNMTLIAVSLEANDWFNDNYKLLNYGFNNYRPYLIYDKNQLVHRLTIDKAKKSHINIVTDNSLFFPLTEEEREKIKVNLNLEDIKLPVDTNDYLGFIQVSLDGKIIRKDKLVSREYIGKENIVIRLHKLIMGK